MSKQVSLKKIIILFELLVTIMAYSQIPANYYSSATGSGYTLKTQLHNKIKGHTSLSYDALWVTYATSDRDNQYENDNTIIDMYSENPTGSDPVTFTYNTSQCGTYNSQGDCYNREHIIPQSVFNSVSPMLSDAHFVTPSDGYVNGMRSNHPHGNVALASWTSFNGSKVGTSGVNGYVGTVFEPIDEFKGDIARMYFYFATRYENTVANYNYDMFDGSSNKVFTTAFLNLLLLWHTQDPVSPREIARNNAIYLRQNNRNPFIDHPQFAAMIWMGTPDIQAPTVPVNLTTSNINSTSINLTWSASTDNVAVTAYNVFMNGQYATTVSSTTATITNLVSNIMYTFYITAIDAAGNVSGTSLTVGGTIPPTIDTIPPTIPTNITTSTIASTSFTINWSNANDNVGVIAYEVYVNGILTSTVSTTSSTIMGLSPTTAYSIYIKAKDAAGNTSPMSSTINLTTCYC